ncbi:putative uncharacterized protein [Bacteroides sp. CAG:598]|nr:putative uncharacterized protein [Bacteroides sp. CAG:598]
MVAGRFAHNVHRGAFAFGNLAHVFDGFLLDEQSHALLALVGDDFLGREGLVADGQLAHVDVSATLFHQLAEAVHVSSRAVVVDGNDGVYLFLAEGAHHVVGTLLHFGVGALDGVQFDAATVSSRIDRRYRSAAQTDAIVVATHYDDLVACFGFALEAIALGTVTYASGQHDDLVVAVNFFFLFMLEGQHRTADERLAELVAEVAGAVRRLDEDLLGCLIQPFAHGQDFFPLASFLRAGVGGHVDGRTCDGPGTLSTTHTVADFTTRTRRCAVERLHGGGEVVRLGLQGDDALDVLHLEVVGLGVVGGSELLDDWTFGKGHVVLVGRYDFVGVFLCGLLDHLEERGFLLHTVDDERTAEDFVAAMLGVDLGKAEHFGVGQRAAEVLLYLLQVVHFLLGEGQTFLLVVGFEVFDVDDGFGLAVGGEHLLVEPLVHALEHGVVFGVFIGHGEVFLDARDARQAHVLGNFHGVRAPGRDHFAAGAYETAFQVFFTFRGGFSKKPAELVAVCLRDGVFACYGNHAFLRSSVERNHIFIAL